MKTPHKHADLIKAWADGAEIEFRWDCLDDWRRITAPRWDQDGDYRIKPERPWVWLTDEEIRQIARNTPIDGTAFARAIEQALKEKNQ